MKEAESLNQLVIVLSEHPVLGLLLIPYIAETSSGQGELRLTEQAFHLSPETLSRMSETDQKVIEIASHYTEKYLMTVYSKDKTISRFLHRVAEDTEKLKTIRLFIEKKLLEMIELIRNSNLPLYQKQSGSKQLYPYHAYLVHKKDTRIHSIFEINETSFCYQLQCFQQDKPVPLTELKPVSVLTSNPATLLLGMEVHTFKHIEASRLLPFTKKNCISVDASLTEKYIENILIPIARYHTISTHGFNIIEEKRACECLLYVEETIYSSPLLRLNFRYGDQLFSSLEENGIKKYFSRRKTGQGNPVNYFRRNATAEKRAVQLLQEAGLEQISDCHFKLSDDAPQRTLTEWISHHRSLLRESFILTSSIQDIPYALDEIRIEQSFEDRPDWFELHITVVIGTLQIPFSRFRKHILEDRHEFTLPDGRVILLPEEWFSKYANLMELGTPRGKAIYVKHPYAGMVQSLLESNFPKEIPLFRPQEEYPIPSGLKAQLRPYQLKGYRWMMNLYEKGFNGCLADDMGLGKTLQTLTLLEQIYHPQNERSSMELGKNGPEPSATNGQFELFGELTVENTLDAPTISQDIKKVQRKPASLIVVPTSLLHNWRREAVRFTTLSMTEYNSNSRLNETHPEQYFNRFHLIFISYGFLRSKIEILRNYCFEYVVLDESQNIKNSESITFRSAIQLQSRHRLVLTGTPIENSLKDIWAQFHFLQPELLGNERAFTKQFINPIKQGDTRMETRLRQLIGTFILRRSKSEVAPELPSLTEEIIYCDMTEKQNEIYQQEKNSLRNTLLKLKFEGKQPQHKQFTVLNGISRLRQLSCHPQMIFPDFTGGSGKLEQVIDTFETLRSEGHKVLIFSSFVKHLELIADELRKRNWKYAMLTGSSTNRPEEITRFSTSEDIQAFLISLKAGGVGLNLTEADYVFIIDPWWNPATEAQAIARAHRIGQDKQVIAYRFITQDSIEEKIIHLQQDKRKLAETFITDTDSIPALTDQEWIGLLE